MKIRNSQQSGFTILEVTIAIGILAVGLLGIAAMSLHALKQGRTGKHSTEAATIAYSVLEEFHRMNFLALAPTPWTPPQPISNLAGPVYPASTFPLPNLFAQGNVQLQGAAQQSQVYNVSWQITDAPIPPSPPWPAGTVEVRKFIEVRITWAEPDWPNRQVTISGVRYDDMPTDI